MGSFLRLIFCFGILICISSCEFTPSGDHFVPIEKKVTVIPIELNGTQDTISIIHSSYNIVSFTFMPSLKGLTPLQSKLFLDEQQIASSDGLLSNPVEVNLSPEKYKRGFHTLRLELITSSGTGSFADKTGAELLVTSKQWTLNVDLDHPDEITLLEALPKDGRIKLKWTPYSRINFSSYRVTARRYMEERVVAIITNPTISECFDSLYVGGDVSYRVDLMTPYPDRYSVSNEVKVNYAAPMLLSAEAIGSSQVKLTWSACQFNANFGKYRITGGPTDLNLTIDQLMDTTVVLDNIPFGADFGYELTTLDSKSRLTSNHSVLSSVRVATGQKIGAFDYVKFNKAYNTLYLVTPYLTSLNTLNSYDGKTYEQISSRPAEEGSGIEMSPQGNYTYVIHNKNIIRIDPLSLKTIGQYPMEDFIKNYSRLAGLLISDNHTMAIQAYISDGFYQNALNGISFWDMNSKELLYQDSNVNSERKLKMRIRTNSLSSSGSYILNDSLYVLANKQLKGIGFHKTDVEYNREYFFTGSDQDQLIQLFGTTITLRNCSDWSIVNQFTTEEILVYATLDPVSGYLGGANPYRTLFRIYDVNTGELIKQIPLAPQANANYFLLNNTLFSSNGYYIKL